MAADCDSYEKCAHSPEAYVAHLYGRHLSVGSRSRFTHVPPVYHKKKGIRILQMYNRVIRPLAELNGLGRFFAHFAWPFAHTDSARRRREAEPGLVEREVNEINRRFERIVMGESYDGSSSLPEPGISQWLERSIDDSIFS
jgi:hypothetical protein